MKTSLLTLLLVAGISATPLMAEEGMKCCCMKEHEAKAEMQKKMETKMKADSAAVDALLEQMNSTTGEKKVEAMAALLNKMLQERKSMQEKMAAMHEKMAQGKKPAGDAAKAGEHEHPAEGEAAKPAEHKH